MNDLKTKFLVILLGLGLILGMPPLYMAQAVTVTLYPTYDTDVDESAPDYNNDVGTQLYLIDPSNGEARPLIQFDTSSLSGTTIEEATLWIYISSVDGNAGYVYVHRNWDSWTSSTVTWNTRPDFDPIWYGTYELTLSTGWVSTNITYLVQLWADGSPDYGIALRALSGTGIHNYIDSIESSNDPYISVDYSIVFEFDTNLMLIGSLVVGVVIGLYFLKRHRK